MTPIIPTHPPVTSAASAKDAAGRSSTPSPKNRPTTARNRTTNRDAMTRVRGGRTKIGMGENRRERLPNAREGAGGYPGSGWDD